MTKRTISLAAEGTDSCVVSSLQLQYHLTTIHVPILGAGFSPSVQSSLLAGGHTNYCRRGTLDIHSMVQEQRVVLDNLFVFLSGFDFADDGWTTTCIVITVLGRSPKGALHCAMFLSFSRIFPPLISLTSLAVFGAIVLSTSRIITELKKLHKI